MDKERLQIIEVQPGDVQQSQPGPILSLLFGDVPIRMIKFEDDFGVPLPDIAKGLNYSLRSLHYMVSYFVLSADGLHFAKITVIEPIYERLYVTMPFRDRYTIRGNFIRRFQVSYIYQTEIGNHSLE